MLITSVDLYRYSIALVNSGITQDNIDMLERQILVTIFEKESAKALVNYINENKKPIESPNKKDSSFGDFGGNTPVVPVEYDYGELNKLIKGDNVLFQGLIALLAVLVCLNLLSQNRIQVARQNVTKQPLSSRTTSRREESDVVQSLSFTAHNLIGAMDDFLKQPGNNPLKLKIRDAVHPARYSTNTSGKMPMNYYWGLFGINYYL